MHVQNSKAYNQWGPEWIENALMLQADKLELQEITRKQNDALDVLREEATALRRDLAFMGAHVQVAVAPENLRVSAIDIQELARFSREESAAEEYTHTQEYSAEGPVMEYSSPDPLLTSEVCFASPAA